MIQINNLTYRYHNGFTALSDVNCKISSGIHLLLGENGAGKTTFMHVIAGLRTPTQGSCIVNGMASCLRNPSTLAQLFIYTDNMLLPCKNIMEYTKSHARFYPSFSIEILQECLKEFGMTGYEPLASLSFGNRRKAQIAYVIALNTDVLLLDEPANGLDITAKQSLRRLLARFVDPTHCVVISTHTVSDLESLFDTLTVIHKGQLITSMPVWQITERLSFRSDMMPPQEYIYCEQEQGLFRYIVANNNADQSTDINYQLLYNALLSPMGNKIIKQLNTPTES
ncbi:MAG: ABC transporter ATP-binding protein [Paramuribaculum sp.]|nr:ABC transporter ATP-binding protein [Paramuribaculum sp.]